MYEYGLPVDFPQDVINESELVPEVISEKEIKSRRDMRDVTTITIDPVDARDFDDALSLKVINDNNFEIGVHIADVSHYVIPDTKLDEEKRGVLIKPNGTNSFSLLQLVNKNNKIKLFDRIKIKF